MAIKKHKPKVGGVGRSHTYDRWDKQTKASRAIYRSPEWRKARKAFLTENPYCVDCGSAANTVDHRTAHRGDMELFWDRSNWQPMCFPCHQRKRGRERHGK